MNDLSPNILERPATLFQHPEDILLYTGQITEETISSYEGAGFQLQEIRPTEAGLQKLREMRAVDSMKGQLFLLFADPEDLAARHSWREFWHQLEEVRSLTTVLVCTEAGQEVVKWGQEWGVQEVFPQDMFESARFKRLDQLIDLQELGISKRNESLTDNVYRIPLLKRLFDILVASTVLLLLSPLLLLVMILIKFESQGPIFYISKRVGTGYRVFDFYKFRSMRTDADQLVKELQHLNQYAEVDNDAPETILISDDMDFRGESMLINDESVLQEDSYRIIQQGKAENTFFKIENDPRITRIGHFIRNTSIDELPQLVNVLKGDMSIVGNRPLPLYEAEQLITDEFTERFNAAAGITGLWQVTERGKTGVSSTSRKLLDVEYAQNYSLWLDFRILFMTLPALFQKSDV
jgi:lipopolysaccharide/colanic/teichoic acid biosynthesis glycosyltransferase